MELFGTVKEINLKTDIEKTGGGTYEGWYLKYTTTNGEEKEIKKPALTLKKVKGLKEALISLAEGDPFSATMEKVGNYWELKELRKGGTPQMSTGGSSTRQFDNNTHTHIIRQNCLSHATQIALQQANPDADQTVEEIKRLAGILEEWVKR